MDERTETRWPTVRDQLQQLAAGAVTSVELTQRGLTAIAASQPTLNAFRVVLTESALAEASNADRRRAAGETGALLGVPIAVKDDVDIAGVPTMFGAHGEAMPAAEDSEVVRRLRTAGAVIVGKTNACELGQWPFTSGRFRTHPQPVVCRAHPGRVVGRQCRRCRGGPGGRGDRVRRGRQRPGSGGLDAPRGHQAAAGPHLHLAAGRGVQRHHRVRGTGPHRGRRRPRARRGLRQRGGDVHQPPPVRAGDGLDVPRRPLRIAVSTRFPFTIFGAKLHPEIQAAVRTTADQLAARGHTVVERDPDYGLRLSVDFLSRSTSGLVEWSDRLGEDVNWDPRTRANVRLGRVMSRSMLRRARANEAATASRVGRIFDDVDVVLAPTTAQPAPKVDAFDRLGPTATDRAIISACPVTFPWNLLGWPSINVPAGFTESGLPMGVQLMGPANSEPLLVSLAAELEDLNRWADRQPQSWWTHHR